MRYQIQKWLDMIVGFHEDCVCNFVDYAESENGKFTALYIDGVKYVPET